MSEYEGAELIVPFVVTRSAGGPYEDESFGAGVSYGMLRALVGTGRAGIHSIMQRTDLLPQIELLAMECGYRMETSTYEGIPDGWTAVDLIKDSVAGGKA